MSKSEKGTNTLYLPPPPPSPTKMSTFSKTVIQVLKNTIITSNFMYVCNAILNIGLPSTYSLMALESKGGFVCKHIVLTFFCKIFSTFFDEKTELNNGST